MNKTEVDELLDLLQQHELKISALYETFASNLPSSRDAWLSLANEEKLHAKWINTLHAHLKNESISLEKTKFTCQSVRTAIAYIENTTASAAKNKPDLKKSLIIAINVEKSLLESQFFTVFELSNLNAQNIRSRLEEATNSHVNKLLEWQRRVTRS